MKRAGSVIVSVNCRGSRDPRQFFSVSKHMKSRICRRALRGLWRYGTIRGTG
jgi:hypothetical protein